jgi:diguanylate cyclase (GGDEF)-like protein
MVRRRSWSVQYASQFSSEQARLGTQLAALALSTAAVVDLTMAVPHGVGVDWTLVAIAGALVAGAMVYTGVLVVQLQRKGVVEPPSWPILVFSLACLASTGLANLAGDGSRGLYLPVFLTVPVFCAVSLNVAGRRVIVLATVVAVASTEWALRTHHGAAYVLAVVVYAWVIVVVDAIAGLVFGVLRARNEARGALQRLVDELAPVEDLEEGIGRCLGGLAQVLPVEAQLLAVDADGRVRRRWSLADARPASGESLAASPEAATEISDRALSSWTADLADQLAGGDPVVRRAASGAPVLEPSRWVLPVGFDDSGPLVLVLEHREPLAGFARQFPRELAGAVGDTVLSALTRLFHLEQLRRASETDPLTGLANRRRLHRELEQALAMADRSGSPLCLAMVDLDAFKAFNDSRGHLEGDHLLRLVAAVLASRVRSTDLVCRYGGDEFCLLLPATDQTGAQELLEDLRALVASAVAGSGVTVSAGLASWDGQESAEDLLDRADHALYQAKQRGRNGLVVASPVLCEP